MQAIRLLPAVFLFAGAVIGIDQFMNERLSWLSHGREVFATSLSATRTRLVSGVWHVVNDPIIVQNLEWNNLNSVGQTIQNYLRPGEVSQIELLDVDCNLLVRVPSSAKPQPSGCRPGQAAKPGLSWQKTTDDIPVLSMVLPRVVAGRPVLVTAHVILDQAWMSSYPELFSLVSRHEFNLFESSSRGLVWKEGQTASGEDVATMRVAGWLSRVLPNFTKYSLEPTASSLWFLYLIMAAHIAVIFLQNSVTARRDRDLRVKSLSWIQSRREKLSMGEVKLPTIQDGWDKIAPVLEATVDRLMEQKNAQTKLMRERQEQLNFSAIQREKQMSDLQEKLMGMSDLASLKEQLQHSTSSFLTRMQDVRELCEDMFDVASDGLARQGKELHEFTVRWKNGVEDQQHRERGARKFLRSMSETPSERPGMTKLDDELDRLGELTSTTLDQSLHLAMIARQALSELESGVQVAALWHGLAMRDSERERTCDWLSCLMTAQKLVSSDNRYGTLTFEKMPQVAAPEETYLPVARVALVSGLFHLYMALLADVTVDAISLPIVLRQKRFADQGTMILSLPHPAHDVADSAPGRGQGYHMELAKAILAPLGIRAAFLPPTIAGVPVALTWPLPGKQVDVAAQKSRVVSEPSGLNLDAEV